MSNQTKKIGFFNNPLTRTKIRSANVKVPEMLFGYFLGPFGALLASGIFSNFLNRYWTDILFADQAVSGVLPANVTTFLTLLPLLSAILIVIGNLVVGQIIERTKSSAGKARPWILLSAVLLPLSCIIMFIVPSSDPVVKMVMTAISYNLYYSVAYPLYSTSNSTLVPLSTRNGNQRGLLASFSNFAGLAVMGVGGMIFPLVVTWILGGWDPSHQVSWLVAFIAIAVITFVFTVLQYYFTRERVTEESLNMPENTQKKVSIKKQLRAVTSDQFWWLIIVAMLLFQFGGAFKNLSVTYFCSQQSNVGWAQQLGPILGITDLTKPENIAHIASIANTVINVLGAIPMAIAMAFIWPLSAKFGKRIVVFVGAVVAAAGGVLAGLVPDHFYVVAIGVALKSFGSSPICYMILAMIADVLDHIEAKRGFRPDGLTMSIYSSIMAASTPIAMGIFNAIPNGGANTFGVTVSYIWIETVAYAACAVLILFFVVEKFSKEDKQIILDRQRAEAEAAGIAWIPPEERLRMEEEEAERLADEARRAELKARCEKKGLDFEEEERKYQQKRQQKLDKKKK